MTEYTFLGMSEAALSMFIEILFSNHGDNFKVKIVRNLSDEPERKYPYMIPGIKSSASGIHDWQYDTNANLLIGVNLVESKRAVYNAFESSFGITARQYSRLVHPSVVSSATTELAAGVVLNPGVVLAPFSSVNELATVNRSVSIGHHSTIGCFSTIHPGVNIAGHCHIGKNVTVGMGANIINGVSVGDNTVIGAGSLVTRDIPDNVVAFGAPAEIIRDRTI